MSILPLITFLRVRVAALCGQASSAVICVFLVHLLTPGEKKALNCIANRQQQKISSQSICVSFHLFVLVLKVN